MIAVLSLWFRILEAPKWLRVGSIKLLHKRSDDPWSGRLGMAVSSESSVVTDVVSGRPRAVVHTEVTLYHRDLDA